MSPFCHSIVIVVAAWSAWPLPTGPTKATRDVMAKIKVDVTSGARHVQKSLGVIRARAKSILGAVARMEF